MYGRNVDGGHADAAELAEISRAWSEWVEQPDGWFAVQHGEINCTP